MARSDTKRKFLLDRDNHTSREDKQFYNYALKAYLSGKPFFKFKGQYFPTPIGHE